MKRAALLLAVAQLAGCVGTDTGNPPLSASLTARSSDSEVAIAPAAAPTVVGAAWLSIGEVRAVLGETCDHVSEPTGAAAVGDLVGGLVIDELPGGRTCGVHVTLAAVVEPPPEAPALAGRALLVTGTRADGAPFELTLDHAPAVHVVTPAPIELSEDRSYLLVFDVARWLSGIDLAGRSLDPDGVARVDPSDPEAAALTEGLLRSAELYADDGDDGEYGSAEMAAGPIATSAP